MKNILFYSTNCPKCKVLAKKMEQKGIEYKEINDIDVMLTKGIKAAPALEIDGEILDYMSSMIWVNNYTGEAK